MNEEKETKNENEEKELKETDNKESKKKTDSRLDDLPEELQDLSKIEISSPEELQKLLNRLAGSGETGDGKNKKKVGIVNRLFPNLWLNLLFYIVLNTILTIALQGYLDIFKADYFYKMVIFSVAFSIIDTLGRDFLYWKVPFLVITSFGLIPLLLTVSSALLVSLLIPNFEIISYWMMIVFIATILLIRSFITRYVAVKIQPYLHHKKKTR